VGGKVVTASDGVIEVPFASRDDAETILWLITHGMFLRRANDLHPVAQGEVVSDPPAIMAGKGDDHAPDS
jgi:hypothetical protein